MKFTESLISIKHRVEEILKNDPLARDSDKHLWLTYLDVYCGASQKINKSFSPFKEFSNIVMDKNTPTMESITRVRRKFQEKGMYLGTVQTERKKEQEEVARWSRGLF